MKQVLQYMPTKRLSPVLRGLVFLTRHAKVSELARLIRYLNWKAKPTDLVDETIIYPYIRIPGPEVVLSGRERW